MGIRGGPGQPLSSKGHLPIQPQPPPPPGCKPPDPEDPRPRELRAFFSCMAWRAIPGPLSMVEGERDRDAQRDRERCTRGGVRVPRANPRGRLRSPS